MRVKPAEVSVNTKQNSWARLDKDKLLLKNSAVRLGISMATIQNWREKHQKTKGRCTLLCHYQHLLGL